MNKELANIERTRNTEFPFLMTGEDSASSIPTLFRA